MSNPKLAALKINLDNYTTDPVEMVDLAEAFYLLSSYAEGKAVAMRQRLDGKIDYALKLEEVLEETYQRLPEELRW